MQFILQGILRHHMRLRQFKNGRESQKYNLYSSNCLINSLKMIEASISGFIEQLYKYKNIYDYEVGGEPAQLGKIVPNYMHGVLEKYFTEFVEQYGG